MQISQMFKRKPCVFSIECFPPKQTANFDKMKDTLRTMRTLNPDFISVTYGAGGSTGGVSTVEVAEFLKNDLNVEPLAHMICMRGSWVLWTTTPGRWLSGWWWSTAAAAPTWPAPSPPSCWSS